MPVFTRFIIHYMFIFKLFIIINYHLKTNEIMFRRFGDIMTPLSRNEKKKNTPLTPVVSFYMFMFL